MKTGNVIIVRVYVTESSHLLNLIVTYLKEEVHIRGLSVFRAIRGFGETGDHVSSLIDLSLNLPLVIEFFDNKKNIKIALAHLSTLVKSEHIVFWPGQTIM